MRIPAASLFALVLLVLAPSWARASREMQDPVYVTIADTITTEQLTRALRAALTHCRWVPGGEKPGYMQGTLSKGHAWSVTIGLSFTTHEVTIRYLDSKGLSYDPDAHSIRGNYNKWLLVLSNEIKTYVSLLATQVPVETPHAEVVPVLAPPAEETKLVPAAGARAVVGVGANVHTQPSLASEALLPPRAAAVTLKSDVSNADGHWWYVTGEATGWVLEAELAGP